MAYISAEPWLFFTHNDQREDVNKEFPWKVKHSLAEICTIMVSESSSEWIGVLFYYSYERTKK